MNTRKWIFIFLVFLLLVGCRPKSGTSGISPSPDVFIPSSGADALLLTAVLDGDVTFFEGEENTFLFKLSNVGSALATNIKIEVKSLSSRFFEFGDGMLINGEQLEGITPDTPFGEELLVEFPVKNIGMKSGLKTQIEEYLLWISYVYETRAQAEVCVNPKRIGIAATSECTPKADVTVGPQGSPIALSHFLQSPITKDGNQFMRYTLFITDEGDGELLDKVSFIGAAVGQKQMQCFKGVGSTAPGSVTTPLLSNSDLGKFPVVLKGEKYVVDPIVVTCHLEIDPFEPPYTSVLTLQLSYSYLNYVRGTITVERIG